jgi:2-C-methyl-D-erythritol 4-phosphate cytidylyltransferase
MREQQGGQAGSQRFIALVPAGGRGERVGAGSPKQYLRLGDRPMIAWCLQALLAQPWIDAVHVVVAPRDTFFEQDDYLLNLTQQAAGRLQWHPAGGDSRQQTVSNGLRAIDADANTWVMVHDAARPGLSAALLTGLRDSVIGGAHGVLLACPVADTVKRQRADGGALVDSTVNRNGLWLAQTPQVFRAGELAAGLEQARRAGVDITDESSAMEHAGLTITLVPGHWRNMKVTTADDLAHMQMVLSGTEDDND